MNLKRIPIVIFLFALAEIGFTQNNVLLTSSNGKVFRIHFGQPGEEEKLQAHVLLRDVTKDTVPLELEFENKKKVPVVIYLLQQGQHCRNKEFNYNVEFDEIKAKLTFLSVNEIHPLPEPLVPVKPVIDTTPKIKGNPFGHFCEWRHGEAVYYNNLPKNSSCTTAMPDQYLAYTAQLISKTELPDEHFSIVENVCRNNCISIAQLSALLKYIDFEVEKLKIVRLAYPHIVDLSNKKELEKSFRFEASINELNSFLKDPQHSQYAAVSNCTKPAAEMIVANYAEKLSTYNNDYQRLEILQKGYADLCYSVPQIILILNKFIHDREKLEAAKLLYLNCVEKDNFMKISDVFSYRQSASDLQDFIDKQSH